MAILLFEGVKGCQRKKKSPISPFVNRNSTRWNDELAYMPQIPKNQEDKRNQLFNSMGFQTTMKVFKSTNLLLQGISH